MCASINKCEHIDKHDSEVNQWDVPSGYDQHMLFHSREGYNLWIHSRVWSVSCNDLGVCRASRDIDTPLLNSSHDQAGFVDAGFAQLNRFEELQISGRLMMQACPFIEIMSSWQTIYHTCCSLGSYSSIRLYQHNHQIKVKFGFSSGSPVYKLKNL